MSESSFGEETRVERLGEGRWRGHFSPRWFGPPGPNGGFIAALMLSAIRAELDDAERLPRSLTLHYPQALREGPAEVRLRTVRQGRSASFVEGEMTQGDRIGARALCVLSRDYASEVEFHTAAPRVAPPNPPLGAERGATDPSPPGPALAGRLVMEPRFGARPFVGAEASESGGWIKTRLPAELDPELLCLYCDAWWPAVFSHLTRPIMVPTLELTIHFRAPIEPTPNPHVLPHVLCRFTTATASGGLVEEDGQLWDESGRLLAQSRQLALLREPPQGKGSRKNKCVI